MRVAAGGGRKRRTSIVGQIADKVGDVADKVADTIALLDPGSFEHCKQVAAAVGNARRAFGGPDAKRLVDAAEAKAAAVHAIRYGCGGTASEEDVAVALELVKRTEHSNEESQGEFCEA